jgi:prepilin-type N-terminal cleavage/methylation domain-containing protein
MRAKGLGFTLVELLVVIAIIAVLAAVMAPVIQASKSAVKQSVAGRAAGQTYLATSLYMADCDDAFPLGMYTVERGLWQTWFGRQTGETDWDTKAGLISSYRGKDVLKDPAHFAQPHYGDMSGLGYNYGFIGSDMHVTGNYWGFPNCTNPATGSSLPSPSTTLVFASSSFYKATWMPDGDGMTYDFGFVDPLEMMQGNPNVDFRHFGQRVPDAEKKSVTSEGRAIVVFADGSTKPRTMEQFKDEWFQRDQESQ